MSDAVQHAHITMILLGFALIPKQRIGQISLIQTTDVTVGRVGRTSHAERTNRFMDKR